MSGKKKQTLANVGLIGLGVMGRNLVLNLADHGFAIKKYKRPFSIMAKCGRGFLPEARHRGEDAHRAARTA